MEEIAQLHKMALPHTLSSRIGVRWLKLMYEVVRRVGYVEVEKRGGKIIGAISGVGKLILTLVVNPEWQHKGIGKTLISQRLGVRWVYTNMCSVGFYEKMGFERKITIGKTIFLRRSA